MWQNSNIYFWYFSICPDSKFHYNWPIQTYSAQMQNLTIGVHRKYQKYLSEFSHVYVARKYLYCFRSVFLNLFIFISFIGYAYRKSLGVENIHLTFWPWKVMITRACDPSNQSYCRLEYDGDKNVHFCADLD